MSYIPGIACYKCGREGHYANQCNGEDPPTDIHIMNVYRDQVQRQKDRNAAFGTANSPSIVYGYQCSKCGKQVASGHKC